MTLTRGWLAATHCHFSNGKRDSPDFTGVYLSATSLPESTGAELGERLPPKNRSRPDRDRLTTEKTPPSNLDVD
jgi:hypothetical protein